LLALAPVLGPLQLGANQPKQFYRGGEAIVAFRGVPSSHEPGPEDWVASTTVRFGQAPAGLSKLPDGTYLKDAVERGPEAWLGPEHMRLFGASTGVLVKLLDAAERLPVHLHPPREFAYRHLGERHGKTESWVIVGTKGAEPAAYLGWTKDVAPDELDKWVDEQDTKAMLGNLHRLPVRPGDAILVPAGTPHAIGEGVFCVEVQEPTDFSIMLELEGFGMDRASAYLGLERELALSCVRRQAFSPAQVAELRRPAPTQGVKAALVEDVLPPAARPYFRIQRVRGGARALEPSFAVLVGIQGSGLMTGEGWHLQLKRGTTAVVPWGAGRSDLNGEVEVLRCLPPLPSDFERDDPKAVSGQ